MCKQVILALKHKDAHKTRLHESNFHPRLSQASVGDVWGGKSKIIRVALFCGTCSFSIKATLPLYLQILLVEYRKDVTVKERKPSLQRLSMILYV